MRDTGRPGAGLGEGEGVRDSCQEGGVRRHPVPGWSATLTATEGHWGRECVCVCVWGGGGVGGETVRCLLDWLGTELSIVFDETCQWENSDHI